MALKDYSKEERETIGKFLGDGEAWREIGATRPAGDFEGLESMAEARKEMASEVRNRIEEETKLLDGYADGTGHIGGKLAVFVRQTVQTLAGRTGASVFSSEWEFKRYMGLLRAVCEELKGW